MWAQLTAALAAATLSPGAPAPVGIVAELNVPTPISQPAGIVVGPDGAAWFTEFLGNKIGRVTPAGTFTEYPIPTAASRPGEITLGPDNALWFAETNASRLGRIAMNGAIDEFPVPSAPRGVTAGPDGRVWFTEEIAARIGALSISSRAVQEFSLPANTFPERIVTGQDGALWFTEFGPDAIGRITTGGQISTFPIPPGSDLDGITEGPDGRVWFTETSSNRIGRMATNGAFVDFPVPTPGAQLKIITAGWDSNLWFTEPGTHKIARITTGGAVTEFGSPTPNAAPQYIAGGPGGMLWFSEAANKIGVASSGFDVEAPSASIASPPEGARYTAGARVVADYTCADSAGGSGIAACTGTVASGGAVDTSRPGPMAITVTARDLAGNTTSSTRSYVVVPAPPTDSDAAVTNPVFADADRDGYPSNIDCDDDDRSVHPGATELPRNGSDDDCVGGDAPFPGIGTTIRATFAGHSHYTAFRTLQLVSVAAGSKVDLRCAGRGCRPTRRTRTLSRRAATLSLRSMIRRIRLYRGTRVELRVTRPGTIGTVARWSGTSPRRTDLCLPPQAKRPASCRAPREH